MEGKELDISLATKKAIIEELLWSVLDLSKMAITGDRQYKQFSISVKKLFYSTFYKLNDEFLSTDRFLTTVVEQTHCPKQEKEG